VKALAWVTEPGWEAVVDALAALRNPHVTLLHVAPDDIIEAPGGAFAGLLGRHHGHELESRLASLTGAATDALLNAASERLGHPAQRVARSGRVEHEVLAAAQNADLLVMSRDALEPGPRSIGHPARFVLDHAPCQVLLVWPGEPPTQREPPPPHRGPPPPPPPPADRR
jgi:nucleotide-binding universal stress UspA family protein